MGLCRLCLSEDDVVIPIFDGEPELSDLIKTCLNIQVSIDDSHKDICLKCDGSLRSFLVFKNEIQMIQTLNNQFNILQLKTVASNAESQSSSQEVNSSDSSSILNSESSQPLKKVANSSNDESQQKNLCEPNESKEEPIQVNPVSTTVDFNALNGNSHPTSSSPSGENAAQSECPASRTNTVSSKIPTQSSAQSNNSAADDQNKALQKCFVILNDIKGASPNLTADDDAVLLSDWLLKFGRPAETPDGASPNWTTDDDDDAPLSALQLKRKCPALIPSDISPSKLQKENLVATKSTNVKNIPPSKLDSQPYSQSDLETGCKADPKPCNSRENIQILCNLCKPSSRKSFKTRFALEIHKKKSHPKPPKKEVNFLFSCKRCTRQLGSVDAKAAHKKYCGTYLAYCCLFCPQQFESERQLMRHVNEEHRVGVSEQQSTSKPTEIKSHTLSEPSTSSTDSEHSSATIETRKIDLLPEDDQVTVDKSTHGVNHKVEAPTCNKVPTKSRLKPADKVRCQDRFRFCTPGGLTIHQCHTRKKTEAEKETKQQATSNTDMFKCPMCPNTVRKSKYVEHLKTFHGALHPEEMARGVIEADREVEHQLHLQLIKKQNGRKR